MDLAKLAISKGAQVDAQDPAGRTALHFAAHGYRDIAELLLAHGANVNAKDNNGDTPLHDAALPWVSGYRRCCPLHDAALRGRKDLVELFLAKGADVKAIDNAGRTPSAEAARRGFTEVVELLRESRSSSANRTERQ